MDVLMRLWCGKSKENEKEYSGSRERLREDCDHFTTGTASKNDSFEAFGEHFNELHVVGLTSWSHLAWNSRHVQDDELCIVALVDDVLV